MSKRIRRVRRPARSVTVVLAGVLLVSACGGDAATGVASLDEPGPSGEAASDIDGVDTEEAVLAFTECLREQGLDVADPAFDADGAFQLDFRQAFGGPGREPGPNEEFEAAMEVCGELMDGVRQQFRDIDITEIEDSLLAFAECMREQGFDVPDPDFSQVEGDAQAPGRARSLLGDLDPRDPAVSDAMETCQSEFGPGVRVPGGRNEG